MLIWTQTALDVLRDATAKAESMNHLEVHPLHLLWVATARSGLEALRKGQNDRHQAKLRFRIARDLQKLPVVAPDQNETCHGCPSAGFKMQRLLLRAADISTRNQRDVARGRVGMTELLRALMADDRRAAGCLVPSDTTPTPAIGIWA